MGTVFTRGDRCFISFKDATGKWRQTSAGTTDRKVAEQLLRDVEAEVEALQSVGATGPVTLRGYATTWIDTRRRAHETDGKQYRSWKDDRGWLDNHVLPVIGHMLLADVRPLHLKKFFLDLRASKKLAPHSIRNIYGVLSALFRDAAMDGLVTGTPCILTDAELGKDDFVDPIAQAEDRYERGELESMIWTPLIPPDERMFAALGAFCGLRLGGIAGLTWRDYSAAEPLFRMTSRFAYDGKPTKTDRPSVIPVHPTLKLLLDDWRAVGWPALFGREPTDTDPIVPRAPRKGVHVIGIAHSEKTGGDLMDRVLDALGLERPAKKTHALRSTHITLLEEDGANMFYVNKWTHPGKKKRDAFDGYRKGNWEALCREMAKLTLAPAGAEVPSGGILEAPGKPSDSVAIGGGGGGSRTPIVSLPVAAGTADFDTLPIAAVAPSGTELHGAPKTVWRGRVGFVQPASAQPAQADQPAETTAKTEPSVGYNDHVTAMLAAALDARRRGEDCRVVRRLVMQALSALDET